jgi:hypothetical protein
MNIPKLTRREAINRGYRALTQPYSPHQMGWLDRVLRDLGGCNVVLVETPAGPEVWRAASELKTHDTADRTPDAAIQ